MNMLYVDLFLAGSAFGVMVGLVLAIPLYNVQVTRR